MRTQLKRPHGCLYRLFSGVAASLLFILSCGKAYALPSYATQTGAPCSACHMGGFGPELTAFGRSFKLGGYTMGVTRNPISAMAVASYVHTGAGQPGGPAPHYKENDNLTLDEASLFLAGKITDHIGSFAQFTYDGVARKFGWDGLDLRIAGHGKMDGHGAVYGVSLNNAPGIEDPWNSLATWSFPYTASALGPTPAAGPLIGGGLDHNVLGVTGYVWLDNRWYAAAGLYGGLSDNALKAVGMTTDDSANLKGVTPYLRLAYQRKGLEIGAFGLWAQAYPGGDRNALTTDKFADIGADASYQLTTSRKDALSLSGRYTAEIQTLGASFALGKTSQRHVGLNDFRANLSYYWDGHVGASVGLFDTIGKADSLLYASNTSLKPDSSGATVQLDFTPWPNGKTPLGPHGATRLGLQYTAFGKFDGSSRNYDGSGRNASDNNTLRAFVWVTF